MKKFNKKYYIIETYDEFLERKYMEETINMFHPNDRSKDDKPLTLGQKAAKTLANNKAKFSNNQINQTTGNKKKNIVYQKKIDKNNKQNAQMQSTNYVRPRTPEYKGQDKMFDNLNSYEAELYYAGYNQAIIEIYEMIENDYSYNEIYESIN